MYTVKKMGYGRKRGRRKTRRRKAKFVKKRSKLADKRINTLVERRMQEVSKAEIRKLHPALCSRLYLWNDYNIQTGVQGQFEPLTFESIKCVCMTRIPQEQGLTQAPQQAADVPETTLIDESSQLPAHDGGNQPIGLAYGFKTTQSDGFRRGDAIKVSSWSCDLAVKMAKCIPSFIPEREASTIFWALVHVRTDATQQQAYEPQAADLPRIMANRPKVFGYHARQDIVAENVNENVKFQTLASGKIRLPITDKRTHNRVHKLFWRPKNPKLYSFRAGDQLGQYATKGSMYLLLSSDVSAQAPYSTFAPNVTACTKLYYRNVG